MWSAKRRSRRVPSRKASQDGRRSACQSCWRSQSQSAGLLIQDSLLLGSGSRNATGDWRGGHQYLYPADRRPGPRQGCGPGGSGAAQRVGAWRNAPDPQHLPGIPGGGRFNQSVVPAKLRNEHRNHRPKTLELLQRPARRRHELRQHRRVVRVSIERLVRIYCGTT